MKSSRLKLKPLTAEAFAPFGDVIQKQGNYPEEINYGQTRKYGDLARVDTSEDSGLPHVHIYRSRPVGLPYRIEVMERHPLGSQAFIPLHGSPFPVVVAPPADELDIDSIRGFLTNGEQGVNFHKGTWHHYQISLGEISDYVVIDRGGPGDNRDEQVLKMALVIEDLPI
jgi:ureidoglycolate lyase